MRELTSDELCQVSGGRQGRGADDVVAQPPEAVQPPEVQPPQVTV